MANGTARKLRKNFKIAEARLWNELRQLQTVGYHFRRQHPIDGFIVDFACHVLRFGNGDISDHLDGVVIEVLAALGAVAKQE